MTMNYIGADVDSKMTELAAAVTNRFSALERNWRSLTLKRSVRMTGWPEQRFRVVD